jgi:dienelactone hydrolase
VILVHGSSGIGPGIELWTHELNGMGISTFAIDGFTGRGLVTRGLRPGEARAPQPRARRLPGARDPRQAPRVDPNRIALMGFSRGGQAALYASVKRFDKLWNKSGAHFAAHVAFYPDCMTTYQADIELMPVPVRIYHGIADDYNPCAPCRDYVKRLRSLEQDVVLTEYAQAHHGFDNPLGARQAHAVEELADGAQVPHPRGRKGGAQSTRRPSSASATPTPASSAIPTPASIPMRRRRRSGRWGNSCGRRLKPQ